MYIWFATFSLLLSSTWIIFRGVSDLLLGGLDMVATAVSAAATFAGYLCRMTRTLPKNYSRKKIWVLKQLIATNTSNHSRVRVIPLPHTCFSHFRGKLVMLSLGATALTLFDKATKVRTVLLLLCYLVDDSM